MSEYPGATIPAKCGDCGRTYFVSKPEYATQPNAVCKDCFDAFAGMTIEELCGVGSSATEKSMTKAEFHKQCVVESFRSGDHVAIKITHVPTGMYEMDSTMTSEFRTRERLLDDLMLRVSIRYHSQEEVMGDVELWSDGHFAEAEAGLTLEDMAEDRFLYPPFDLRRYKESGRMKMGLSVNGDSRISIDNLRSRCHGQLVCGLRYPSRGIAMCDVCSPGIEVTVNGSSAGESR